MKREKIIRDGKFVGIKNVFEAGDKYYEQHGDFVYLEKDATQNDYEDLVNNVLKQTLEFIKNSGKSWDLEGSQFVFHSKEDYESGFRERKSMGIVEVDVEEEMKVFDGKVGTLGFKVVISRIVEEGENL